METRANYALIGLFTLATLAAVFGFIYWLGGRDGGTRAEPMRIVFSGSVQGLSRGSNVLFNGIRVGEVTDLRFLPDDPKRVVATISVDKSTPIKSDTRARLEYQGLTGVASVGLSGGDAAASDLKPTPGQPLAVIYAERSDFQDILETVRDLSRKVDDTLTRVNRVVEEAEGPITRTVRNVEKFSQALEQNSGGVGTFLASVASAADKIGPLASRLEVTVANADNFLKAFEPDRVSRILTNTENFTKALGDNKTGIDQIVKEAATLTRQLNLTTTRLDSVLMDAGNVLKSVDSQKVGRSLDALNTFSAALEKNAPRVEQIMADTSSITAKFNVYADRIDGVLKAVESFLGSASGEEGTATFASIGEAARSIRALADNLDRRTADITSGINRFTGTGLREYEALANESRKTLNEVNRTLKNIERNPQQLIFGGKPSIPEYKGQR
jgi:phospholipid/cholesterol/gamma-HCH transport system substrate-binding protein